MVWLSEGVPLQGGLLCLCSCPCRPGRRLFSCLMPFTLQFAHVTWAPAYNGTSVCGSAVARETFRQEANADGWQPLHMAWFYLMRCPWVPPASDKLLSLPCCVGMTAGPAPVSTPWAPSEAWLGGRHSPPPPFLRAVTSFMSTWRLSLKWMFCTGEIPMGS